MTNAQKIQAAYNKFGYGWNPRKAWKNVTMGVVPYTNIEFIPILVGKIAAQKKAVRPIAGLVQKYETFLEKMLLADPSEQALNPDFNPKLAETNPDKFWEYFHSLK